MGWPQIVVLVFMLLGTLTTVIQFINNPTLDLEQSIVRIVLSVLLVIGYALILHAGGFW